MESSESGHLGTALPGQLTMFPGQPCTPNLQSEAGQYRASGAEYLISSRLKTHKKRLMSLASARRTSVHGGEAAGPYRSVASGLLPPAAGAAQVQCLHQQCTMDWTLLLQHCAHKISSQCMPFSIIPWPAHSSAWWGKDFQSLVFYYCDQKRTQWANQGQLVVGCP